MATRDDLPHVRVAAVVLAQVVADLAPAAAPRARAAVDVPVGMAGSVAAGDAVAHHSRRHDLSAKRFAQRGQ